MERSSNIKQVKNPRSLWTRGFFIFVCVFFVTTSNQARTVELNPRLERAYHHIIHLDFNAGQILLNAEKKTFPDNYLVPYLENYIDFFTLFINEEVELFEKRKKRQDERINIIKRGDSSSPYYLFCQAEILLQWSLIRLKFEYYSQAIYDINKAIKLLEKNQVLYPDFIANKKSLSALHALIGTIPPRFKRLLGYVSHFNGTIEQGYEEICSVVQVSRAENSIYYEEAIAIKALIELHLLNEGDRAYETIQKTTLDPRYNPLTCFLLSNIAHKSAKNDEAITYLEQFQASKTQYSMHYLDYLLGIYKLNRLDSDAATYIRKYLNYFDGVNYIKEAYQKLAWYECAITHDLVAYEKNRQYCLIKGSDVVDEDRQAESWAKNAVVPNPYLLRVRLLSDGSYYERAIGVLNQINTTSLSEVEILEYWYRQARLHQALHKNDLAIRMYKMVLSQPVNTAYYYRTASALYAAQIYEEEGKGQDALNLYQICLESKTDQYENSLHQKARVGIQRIELRHSKSIQGK